MSCVFCNSFFHASPNCDIYVSDESRRQILLTKKRCGRCLTEWNENSDSACCQKCQFNEKCYICFSKWHHTVYCPDKYYGLVSSIPSIDNDLMPRFINSLNLEENYILAFMSPVIFNLIKPKQLTVIDSNVFLAKPIKNSNLFISKSFNDSRETVFLNNSTFLLPPWHSVIFKCKIITAERATFSSAKHFLHMFSSSSELLRLSFFKVNVSAIVKFVDILKAAPNLEIIDFDRTFIKIDKTWPEDLIKWNKGMGLSKLRIPIGDINFDMNKFVEVIKTKSKNDVKIILDISDEISKEAYIELFAKMCKHFIPANPSDEGPIIQLCYKIIPPTSSNGRTFTIKKIT